MSKLPHIQKRRAQDELANELRTQIQSGNLKAGDFLLPERQLAERYSVSSRVVRESLATLEAEGLISREQGRGTIVLGKRSSQAGVSQKNIAVIFLKRIRDTSSIEFFDTLQQTFQRAGYGTTVLVSDHDPEKEAEIVRQVVRDGVSGIVLFSAHPSDSFAHLKEAQDAGVKVTLFDHFFPGLETNFAGIDDRLGAFEATSHLLHLGCEQMLFINSSVDWTTHSLRRKGFEDAMAKLAPGMPFKVLDIPSFDEMQEYLEAEIPQFLPTNGQKLGVVSWWDQAALHAITCLQANGLSVPRDAAVIGFADDLDSAIASVPLTTMKIPREEIARLSAYLLLDQLRDPQLVPQHVVLRPHLIIRESCGCYQPSHFVA